MADQADVENALVGVAAMALYPDGFDTASVAGKDCRIYRGWPSSAALDSDLTAGRINVSVFPADGVGRNTTRYPALWLGSRVQPSLAVSVCGNSVYFGGLAAAGQIAGILVAGRSYVYRTQVMDTPASVAANIAVLMRSDWIVQLSGTGITVNASGVIVARVVADVPVLQEVRRQEQTFRISCWCPDPDSRDTTATVLDQSFAVAHFLNLPDGSQARIQYGGTAVFDQSQDALLYRRDLLYTVEYPTTIRSCQPAMLFGDLLLNAGHFIA